MVKREVRENARILRHQGMSVLAISKAVGVAKSTVSLWVRDIELTSAQIEALKESQRRHAYAGQYKGGKRNREIFMAKRVSYQEEGRAKARENRPLHQAGCMLYWAEGAKERNEIYFVNSDSNMIRMFIRFLREEMFVVDEDISLYIHCHYPDPLEQQRIEQYWVQLLGLQDACLRKTQVKKGSTTRKNILVNGVCGVRVARSTHLAQHIYGAIQEYAGFDNPAWLF